MSIIDEGYKLNIDEFEEAAKSAGRPLDINKNEAVSLLKSFVSHTVKDAGIQAENIPEEYMDKYSNYPDVVSANEAHEMLGVCTDTVYRLVKSGKLPGIMFSDTMTGNSLFFTSKASVINYMYKLGLKA